MLKFLGNIKKTFKDGKKVCSEGQAFLTCLTYTDEGYHIAHCLEFDIVAQGNSYEEATRKLSELIKEQIQFATEKDAEEKMIFHPAPKKYWDILFHIRNKHARKELLHQKGITTQNILNRLECFNAAYSR